MHVLGFTADEGKWMNGHVLGEFTEAGDGRMGMYHASRPRTRATLY